MKIAEHSVLSLDILYEQLFAFDSKNFDAINALKDLNQIQPIVPHNGCASSRTASRIYQCSEAYLITRPEIKSAQELKGLSSAVTRYGSTTHFYLRAALKHVGLNPEKDMTILQMGAGPEMALALERGVIAAAALTTRYPMPFLQKGWPVLVDLSNTDLFYRSSCVTSSRAFIRAEPKVTEALFARLCRGNSID